MEDNNLIHLKKLSVTELGPIKELNLDFGLVNLIYGRNELGKTFLVEFILKSLFSKRSNWRLRKANEQGRIFVTGFNDRDEIFSPNSVMKLVDHLDIESFKTTVDISRLLVVKGADLGFEKGNQQDISKQVILNYLSNLDAYRGILSKIKTNIQNAEISSGMIQGKSAGDINKRKTLIDEHTRYENLLDEITNNLPVSRLTNYQKELKGLESAINDQEEARRYKAYLFSEEIKDLTTRLDDLNLDEVSELEKDIYEYRKTMKEADSLHKIIDQYSHDIQHQDWLEKAIYSYEKPKLSPSILILISLIPLVFLIIAFILMIYDLNQVSLILIGITIISMIILGLIYRRNLQSSGTRDESIEIKKGFQVRFGKPFSDIISLIILLEEMQNISSRMEVKTEDLNKLKLILDEKRNSIDRRIFKLGGRDIKPEEWEDFVNGYKAKHNQISANLQQSKEEFARLDVNLDDLLEHDPGFEFDYQKKKELKNQRDVVRVLITESEGKNIELMNKAIGIFGDQVGNSWEKIIESLRNSRIDTKRAIDDITASLLAQIITKDVIKSYENNELEHIREVLNSEIFTEQLLNITGRYSSIQLEEDDLYLLDDFHKFRFSDLSTATKEQIQFSIRLGFIRHLLSGRKMFLILDDAFQHSDWERRERLVQMCAELARRGWQIIYFTMDDHIRQLFQDICNPIFLEKFVSYELN